MDSIRERFAALRKDLRLFVELVDSSVRRRISSSCLAFQLSIC